MDLNHRPPGPEPGALARLRYAPTVTLGCLIATQAGLSDYHSSIFAAKASSVLGRIPQQTGGLSFPTSFNLNLDKNQRDRRGAYSPPAACCSRGGLAPPQSLCSSLERVPQRTFHHTRLGQ